MIFSTSMSANRGFLAWDWSVGLASVSAGSSSHEIMTFCLLEASVQLDYWCTNTTKITFTNSFNSKLKCRFNKLLCFFSINSLGMW